jgi:hypothetical protein
LSLTKMLIGKTIEYIKKTDDTLRMITTDGDSIMFYHDQDCCESVYIEDVCGDLDDLIGSPIIMAEEATSEEDPDGAKIDREWRESFTWTFYKFATIKGYVTIRWYGESNGYYSESVDISFNGKRVW